MSNTSYVKLLKIFYWFLALAPLLATGIAYSLMTDKVVIHFGADGTPDGWADKWAAFLIPAGVVVFAVVMFYIAKLSAKYSDIMSNNRMIAMTMLLGALVIFDIISVWSIFVNVPGLTEYTAWLDFSRIIYICFGLAMIFFGLLVPKLSANSFTGARVPWRITDASWSRLQRLSQKLLIIGGLLIILLSGVLLTKQAALFSVLAVLCIIGVLVLIYGYNLKKLH